jgi:hypothetical protein
MGGRAQAAALNGPIPLQELPSTIPSFKVVCEEAFTGGKFSGFKLPPISTTGSAGSAMPQHFQQHADNVQRWQSAYALIERHAFGADQVYRYRLEQYLARQSPALSNEQRRAMFDERHAALGAVDMLTGQLNTTWQYAVVNGLEDVWNGHIDVIACLDTQYRGAPDDAARQSIFTKLGTLYDKLATTEHWLHWLIQACYRCAYLAIHLVQSWTDFDLDAYAGHAEVANLFRWINTTANAVRMFELKLSNLNNELDAECGVVPNNLPGTMCRARRLAARSAQKQFSNAKTQVHKALADQNTSPARR